MGASKKEYNFSENYDSDYQTLYTPDSELIREFLPDGTIAYSYLEKGNYHRNEGPAIITPEGAQEYFIHSLRHRENGPAIIYSDGSEEYWLNNQRHRIGGPAYIEHNEYQKSICYKWYIEGVLHREDGPAILTLGNDGTWKDEEWYYYGIRHRDPKDGYAINTGNNPRTVQGIKRYYIVEGKIQ